MTNPTVTVLIPAFNAATFISRAINSALTQEGVDHEVLVVDDGSHDGTAAVVAAIAQKQPRVRLLRQQHNAGPAEARNLGIEEAGGEWIALLDADDAYLPGRLARLTLAGLSDVEIVSDTFLDYDAEHQRVAPHGFRDNDQAELIGIEKFVAGARPFTSEPDLGLLKPMFRRRFLMEHGLRYPADVRHGEDFLFLYRALAQGACFVLRRQPGYLYTTRHSGMSRTTANYAAMIEQTFQLRGQSPANKNARLNALLLQRMKALARLECDGAVAKLINERRWSVLAQQALSRSGTRLSLARKVGKRLFG